LTDPVAAAEEGDDDEDEEEGNKDRDGFEKEAPAETRGRADRFVVDCAVGEWGCFGKFGFVLIHAFLQSLNGALANEGTRVVAEIRCSFGDRAGPVLFYWGEDVALAA
jgi:hypothetical protein